MMKTTHTILLLVTALACCALVTAEGSIVARFPKDFLWGVANAPAQAEDGLMDGWVDFARRGHVKAWNNQKRPEDRVMFWSQPELEINDAANGGSNVFRMGMDWTRLAPNAPKGSARGVQDKEALRHYVDIVKMIRAKGMRVMMTLFHHSIPMWAADAGGWTNDEIMEEFVAFAFDVVDAVGEDVDYWVTFNEPTVFAMFVYCSGMWPPGPEVSTAESLACIVPMVGKFSGVMARMAKAHHRIYEYIKQKRSSSRVGIAHNVGVYAAFSFLDQFSARAIEESTLFPFVDSVKDSLDFCGLNYYGRELAKGFSVAIDDKLEYSESGRGVWPTGLFSLLLRFHHRYITQQQLKFKFLITENGISDKTDILRPSYLVEHLLAVRAAMDMGVEVEGYIHWGTSDNWEWADGYCPGFGLVAVDRETMTRTPRGSYYLYKDIQETGLITEKMRTDSWAKVRDAVKSKVTRPFCRSQDGKSALDEPVQRPIIDQDWRFTPKAQFTARVAHAMDQVWKPSTTVM